MASQGSAVVAFAQTGFSWNVRAVAVLELLGHVVAALRTPGSVEHAVFVTTQLTRGVAQSVAGLWKRGLGITLLGGTDGAVPTHSALRHIERTAGLTAQRAVVETFADAGRFANTAVTGLVPLDLVISALDQAAICEVVLRTTSHAPQLPNLEAFRNTRGLPNVITVAELIAVDDLVATELGDRGLGIFACAFGGGPVVVDRGAICRRRGSRARGALTCGSHVGGVAGAGECHTPSKETQSSRVHVRNLGAKEG